MNREYISVSYYRRRNDLKYIIKIYFYYEGIISYTYNDNVYSTGRKYFKAFINSEQKSILQNKYTMGFDRGFVHGVQEVNKCLMMLELLK